MEPERSSSRGRRCRRPIIAAGCPRRSEPERSSSPLVRGRLRLPVQRGSVACSASSHGPEMSSALVVVAGRRDGRRRCESSSRPVVVPLVVVPAGAAPVQRGSSACSASSHGPKRPRRRRSWCPGRDRDGAHRLVLPEPIDGGDQPADPDERQAEHADQDLRHRLLPVRFTLTRRGCRAPLQGRPGEGKALVKPCSEVEQGSRRRFATLRPPRPIRLVA